MWENEVIMLWFSFYLLIGVFILLLATLIKSHLDHRELIDALKHLPMHSRGPKNEEEVQQKGVRKHE